MRIGLIKTIDNLLGTLLVKCLSTPKAKSVHKPNSILFIRPGGIGDAVLLVPAIKVLKQKYPESNLTILAENRNASVYRLCQNVDQILRYDNPRELFEAIRSKYDVVIDTEQWHRLTAIVTRFTKNSISIGFATNERKRMFTKAVRYSHEDYERDSFFHLLAPLGITSKSSESPFLVVPEAAAIKASSLLGDLADRTFVTIFPGASVPEKRWDVRKFMDLSLNINMAGYPIVVIGSEKERGAGEAIVHGLNSLNLAGKTSLVETAALIEKSSLLVSVDSGVLHIAAGLGKPTVSLFGPSNTNKWAPRGERHIVINRKLPCSPCSKFGYTPKCANKAKCLADISVDEVVAAIKQVILNCGF